LKILLTMNKTYRGLPDSGHWYFYEPLKELGHEVYWYDTVEPIERNYAKVIETFKPELIFCCFTGDHSIAPYEPWSEVLQETATGRTKTFNWFCDDTWRFDNFSSKACKFFNVCSTPEPSYLKKYHKINFKNIILANWHANLKHYPRIGFDKKTIDISFIGNLTEQRKKFFDHVSIPVTNIFGVTSEEMFLTHSKSKIGINLSRNDNDPLKKTQMKQRIFEVTAGNGLLLTEYHPGIEQFYKIDKEIITFKTIDEFNKKASFLLKNPKIIEQIANNGFKRFSSEHDSQTRLTTTLEKINKC